jgi:glycosyltransferase involved in cell wall biosynthesis
MKRNSEGEADTSSPIPRTLGDNCPQPTDTTGIRPRMGVLATHAIQYQAPLYQDLARRTVVDLEVAFLSQSGAHAYHDQGFGITVEWDIDLLSGYEWIILEHERLTEKVSLPLKLAKWVSKQDVVVLHGHSDPRMLLAAAICRIARVPYILRGEAHAETTAKGWRRLARHTLAWFSVSGASAALPIGQLNSAFYDRYKRIPHFWAPYSVDNNRFRSLSNLARADRRDRLSSLGLDPNRPTVIFSGKLTRRKRPLDAIRAIENCGDELNLVLVGDGPLRDEVRGFEARLPVRCTGFVNQANLPRWYASGDVLVLPSESEPWGLVVNEAMACGLVPVVSTSVGCAPDLVDGVGEIVPVGDIDQLSQALLRAAQDSPGRRDMIRERVNSYAITETARGYERAALARRR